MKKNHGFPYKWGIKMRYVLLVIQVALFLPQWGHASNNVLLPGPKISFSMKDALMKDVIWELEKRSGFVFAYNANDLLKAGKVSVEVKDKDVYEALDICLKGTGLTYVVQQDVIVIKRADAPVQEVKKVTITGRVVDKDSLPLPGVTILLKHTTMGVVTDQNGRYSITIPDVQEPESGSNKHDAPPRKEKTLSYSNYQNQYDDPNILKKLLAPHPPQPPNLQENG